MATWKGQTRGGVAGHLFFIFILKHLGIRFTYFFLHFVVTYFVFFSPKARKPIYYYFNTILGYGKLKSFRYVYKNNYKLGQVLIDKVAMMAGFFNKFTFEFDGEENIRKMAAEGGGLLIGAHIGNWEIAGQLLERIDTKVNILMLEAEHEKIKQLLDSVMTKRTMHIIPIKDDLSHLILIKKALQNNEIVTMHADRYLEGAKTLTKTFMGYPAKFPEGPFYLAVKYNKPVIFVSGEKETDTHYHLSATQAYYPDTIHAQDKAMDELLNLYIKRIEEIITAYPEQWFNYYYFWESGDNKGSGIKNTG